MAYVYLNGSIVEQEQAGVSLMDIGLLRGYGVFEVIRTFGKKPFLLPAHLERLGKSAAFMNIRVPSSNKEITRAIGELIEKNGVEKEAQIRIVLTGGPSKDSITFDSTTPTFFILVNELPQLPRDLYEKGIMLVTAEHQRQIPLVKTLDYLKAVRMYPEVRAKGAFEILYVHDGNILEATTSNFFIVKDGVAITPKDSILLGTTRNFVIDLCKKNGIPLKERELTFEELKSADEAFITATNKDVVPVVKVGEITIGTGTPGPLTQRLMNLFQEAAIT